MANRERGEVSFEASGQTWTLKVGTNTMCDLEEQTGKAIAEIGELLGSKQGGRITLMRQVFCAALQSYHEGLSPKDCGDLIDQIGMVAAAQKIGEAFQAAFPKAKEGSPRPPKAPTAE